MNSKRIGGQELLIFTDIGVASSGPLLFENSLSFLRLGVGSILFRPLLHSAFALRFFGVSRSASIHEVGSPALDRTLV